jgi:hypothetical protein
MVHSHLKKPANTISSKQFDCSCPFYDDARVYEGQPGYLRGFVPENVERETGIEPATNGLGSRYSTIELLPPRVNLMLAEMALP